MRRFTFRPERILRLRRQVLQAERARLGQAMTRLKLARQALDDSRRAWDGVSAALFARLQTGSPVSGAQLGDHLVLLVEARRRERHWGEQVAEAGQAVEAQRRRVVQAHRAVRVLERLRERRLAQYRREAEREEMKVLDEAGAVGFLRRRLNGDWAGGPGGS